jgi:hypothetical protein
VELEYALDLTTTEWDQRGLDTRASPKKLHGSAQEWNGRGDPHHGAESPTDAHFGARGCLRNITAVVETISTYGSKALFFSVLDGA